MDVKSAFLNGERKYTCANRRDKENSHKVFRLTLYGAPRAWNAKLHISLTSLGFDKSASEHALYRRGTDSSCLLVGVYVDDLLIIVSFFGNLRKLGRRCLI